MRAHGEVTLAINELNCERIYVYTFSVSSQHTDLLNTTKEKNWPNVRVIQALNLVQKRFLRPVNSQLSERYSTCNALASRVWLVEKIFLSKVKGLNDLRIRPTFYTKCFDLNIVILIVRVRYIVQGKYVFLTFQVGKIQIPGLRR